MIGTAETLCGAITHYFVDIDELLNKMFWPISIQLLIAGWTC